MGKPKSITVNGILHESCKEERAEFLRNYGNAKNIVCYEVTYHSIVEFFDFLCIKGYMGYRLLNEYNYTPEQLYDRFVCDVYYYGEHFSRTIKLLEYLNIKMFSYAMAYIKFLDVKKTIDYIIQVKDLMHDLSISYTSVCTALEKVDASTLRSNHTVNQEINGKFYTYASEIARDFDLSIHGILAWIQEDISTETWVRRLSPVTYNNTIYKTERHWIVDGLQGHYGDYLKRTRCKDNPQQHYLQVINRRHDISCISNFYGYHISEVLQIFGAGKRNAVYESEDLTKKKGTALLWSTSCVTGFRGFTEDEKVIRETDSSVIVESFSEFLCYVKTLDLK